MRRPRLAEPPGALDLDELAYLAGGTRRVVETSLARMIEDGRVRTNRGGVLTAVGEPREPLDRIVHGEIGPRGSAWRPVLGRLLARPEVHEFGAGVYARGYLVTRAGVLRARLRWVRLGRRRVGRRLWWRR